MVVSWNFWHQSRWRDIIPPNFFGSPYNRLKKTAITSLR
jgi:hypothetical protein